MVIVICTSCVILALREPGVDDADGTMKTTLDIMENVVTLIFVVEFFIKGTAKCYWKVEGAYFLDPWCVLEFCVVVLSVSNWGMSPSLSSYSMSLAYDGRGLMFFVLAVQTYGNVDVDISRSLRASLAIRSVRMIGSFKNTRIVFLSVVGALPQFVNVSIVAALFYFQFAVLGMSVCTFLLFLHSLDLYLILWFV
jgi:hypothetical protein